MDEKLIKLFLESENGWIAIIIFVLWIAFKIIQQYMNEKKAKTREELMTAQYNGLISKLDNLPALVENVVESIKPYLVNKNKEIDSINYRLKVIASQYGGELSKESAATIIQNLYYNFATQVANEIYEVQKTSGSRNNIKKLINNKVQIINDEKMQELEQFSYRNRQLITYTSGKIIEPEEIIKIYDNYSEKNGMLRAEIESTANVEANKIINRF